MKEKINSIVTERRIFILKAHMHMFLPVFAVYHSEMHNFLYLLPFLMGRYLKQTYQ